MTREESPGQTDRDPILNSGVSSRSSVPSYREYLWMMRWRIGGLTLAGGLFGGLMGWLFL